MSTASFTKNVHIQDPKVVKRFLKDLEKPTQNFDYIKPRPLENNTNKVIEAWFKR